MRFFCLKTRIRNQSLQPAWQMTVSYTHLDCRAELLTAQAVRAGADLALAKKLLETGTTEEAVQILKEAGCLKETMEKVTEKIAFYMNYHIEGRVQTEAIVFSSNEGLLGETPGAGELLERLREQEEKENRKE